MSQAQRVLWLVAASPFRLTHLSPEDQSLGWLFTQEKAQILTTFSSDVSQPGEVTQPANAHINLSCSLQKQFIPRNDFIISYRFTESHNTSPLSDNHSVLALRRQFALPVSQDARTCMQKERKKARERDREERKTSDQHHHAFLSMIKKSGTNCACSLPCLKSLTCKCVILHLKFKNSCTSWSYGDPMCCRGSVWVQVQTEPLWTDRGATGGPRGTNEDQNETEGDESAVLVQRAEPAAARTWRVQESENDLQKEVADDSCFQSKIQKLARTQQDFWFFRYRI